MLTPEAEAEVGPRAETTQKAECAENAVSEQGDRSI